MTKKEQLIKQIHEFDNKYFNDDQKTIAIKILKNCAEEEAQSISDFIFYKRRTGFAFDYSPEIAKGRIITLIEDKSRRINVGDKIEKNENKLIIGDNFNALKALLLTHRNLIDIIYIDPPYNTESASLDGNNSSKEVGKLSGKFVFKDKFGPTGWLNLMKDRLNLAKDLLSEDGAIFVSIDDASQAYLKILMDEIFGSENFITNFNWQSSFGGKNDTKLIPVNTEYILCYSYLKEFQKIKGNKGKFIYSNKYFEEYGNYRRQPLYWASLPWAKSLDYVIYVNKNNDNILYPTLEKTNETISMIVAGSAKWTYEEKLEKKTKRILIHNDNDWCFYWSGKSILDAFEKGFIEIYKKNNGIFEIAQLKYENADYSGKKNLIREGDMSLVSLRNVISDPKISSKTGNEEFESLFNNKMFSYPKPSNLIKLFLKIHPNKNSIVLDFFAGSGTTGQAVLELNNEDGGNRSFILVTNEGERENINIALDITYERLHRIIKKIGFNGDKKFGWLDVPENLTNFINAKLRVIDIDDSKIISLDAKYPKKIIDMASDGIKLLDENYNKKDLKLYYDLSALNPIVKDDTNGFN